VYFFTKLDMTKFTSALIYFGYMGLVRSCCGVGVRVCVGLQKGMMS
jgi:hypothetical protein